MHGIMKLLQPILYSLVAPFNPKWAFRSYADNHNKAKVATYSFIFGILSVVTVYSIRLSSEFQVASHQWLVNLLGFILGLTFKYGITGYLLLLIVNRTAIGKLKWSEALAIVSFALIPLALGLSVSFIDQKSTSIGHALGTIWHAAIMIGGLHFINSVKLWKATILVAGLMILMKIITLVFKGTII